MPVDADLREHVVDCTGGCVATADPPAVDGLAASGASAGEDGPEAPSTDTWTCPRSTFGEQDRCLFHLSPERRRDLGVDQGDVRDALLAAVDEPGRDVKSLVGAHLAELDLRHRRVVGPDNFPLDLRDATVEGRVVLDRAALEQPLYCQGASLGGVHVAHSTVTARTHFDDATVDGDVVLVDQFASRPSFAGATVAGSFGGVTSGADAAVDPAVFHRGIDCSGATFGGPVRFYADFDDEPEFGGATFEDAVDLFADVNADSYFSEADFHGPVAVYAAFEGSTRFNGATFHDDFSFYGRVDADAHFPGATFRGDAAFRRTGEEGRATRFYQLANFLETTFEGAVTFDDVEFIGTGDFQGATFAGPTSFAGARFERRADLQDVTVRADLDLGGVVVDGRLLLAPRGADDLRVVDLQDAHLDAGTVTIPEGDPLVLDLTRATVGDVAATASGGLFDHLLVERTDFQGFDFSDHRQELQRRGWRLHDTTPDAGDHTADDPEALEVTYMKAKRGAKAEDEALATSNFFLRELRYRRRRHRSDLAAPRGQASPVERLAAAGRLVANLLMDVTCGYGERPWRVVASSVGVVVLFAGLFRLLGVVPGHGPTVVGYTVFSAETFVALVLGSPTIDGPIVNLATSMEAFLGAYFIALFVFTLTRSIRR